MRNGFWRPPPLDRLPAEARAAKTPVEGAVEQPAAPGPTQQVIDVAAPDRLEQLQDLLEPVEPPCEQNHCCPPWPAARGRRPLRFYPAQRSGNPNRTNVLCCWDAPDRVFRDRREVGPDPGAAHG